MSLLSFFRAGWRTSRGYKSIDVRDAHERAAAGALVFVDVRTANEWATTGRPAGSVGITLQDSDFVEKCAAALNGDRGAPIALTCRSGARSSQGAAKLAAASFTDVSNVTGGFLEWCAQDLPIDEPPFS